MIAITQVCYAQRREPPFEIDRKHGYTEYSFVHFSTGIQTKLNGKTVSLPPHTCIIWETGTPQYFTTDVAMVHDWFHFTIEDESIFEQLNLPLNQWLFPKKWHFISEIVQEIQDEFFSEKPQRAELMGLKAKELFIKLSRFPENASDDSVANRLRRLRNQMLGSLDHSWTVEELAAELSLSPSRFHALYHAQYGTSPIDDLVHARIEMAQYELIATDHSVREIAEALGYSNITHFSRQFKAYVGMSPLQYRKSKKA
ncbi:MAG: helix-turn-helix transcriptional regulator [Clostridia bacterium]|nr:helix-turn-helix transcriptional regulator [Clostridia bacterium]